MQRSETLDLDAYFHRIGYAGPRTPAVETLRGVHLAHASTIPFENLDPLLGRPVRLDAASLQEKLIHAARGGYCFEHNLLFGAALRACGFQVTGLGARVTWGLPAGTVAPRLHMLLRVDVDGESYVADVGFGGLTLTAPLRLETGVAQPTPHEHFRLSPAGDEFLMEARLGEAWVSLYRFGLAEQFPPDYEVANWYVSTHPESFFTFSLLAARPAAHRRYALRDNALAVHHLDGRTERRTLGTVAELRRVLEEAFLITLPDVPELDAALAKLIRSPEPA